MQCNHSCVFQSQFRSSFCLARHWLGLDPSAMLSCTKQELLDMWLLPMGVASPWLDRCGGLGAVWKRISARSQHGRSHPWQRSWGRGLTGKASQVSRGPLPEHLPQNQNLSLYCLLYYTLLTLTGAVPDHLSLEKVNLELQLVSCI